MPKRCPFCNASMGIKAIYCPRCGKKQPKLTDSEQQELREKPERIQTVAPAPWEELKPKKNRYPLYMLGLIPLAVIVVFTLSRSNSNMAEYTPVAQIIPTPEPTPRPMPSPTPVPTPTPSPTQEPVQLEALRQSGNARTYKPYTLLDGGAGSVPVVMSVLPEGWTGSGAVLWDAHSAEKPGRYVFTAVSPDGQAGLTLSSAMKFVDVRMDENIDMPIDYLLPGLPRQQRMDYGEICSRFIPTFNSSISDISIGSSVDMDTSAAISQYTAGMEPYFSSLGAGGYSVEAPYVSAMRLSGSGNRNGWQCDLTVDLVTSGFTSSRQYYEYAENGIDLVGNFNMWMDYWNLDYMCVYYAPPGQMGNYLSDMNMIIANLYENRDWQALNDNAASQINSFLSQNTEASYGDMVQYAQGVFTSLGSDGGGGATYSKYYAIANIDFAAGQANGFKTIQGAGYSINVDGKWQYIWMAESGDIIAVSEAEYDPNKDATQNGQTWTRAGM